ncbi:MAG: MFS transporter [Clostridium sp.]|nr:MFS transporter [Prevotella sp.]MCM1429281.1 MFS transporter [Clostridium sp.]MCM1475686.1 MFS transporter [Muribaculaceae bacterium]
MKQKPDLSFWKLWDLSFGFFGVQIAYALQSANVSRIFTTIGADPHDLSYFWILPPLMGLIVQPIVGMLSDRTWNRFGRRLPYLIVGALAAVIVMCALPNAGSLNFTVSGAILFGLIALMLLDTSINMAMQPFKMLVGDMVNEKQKSKAYSIQSFLCNAGSVMGYLFPICLAAIGIQNFAPSGEVPPSVVWSFYIGASILLLCVIYSLIKIKEWPPKIYNEYNGVQTTPKGEKQSANVISLLKNAPSTFWTVGVVQFFCWFAFLFLWTYVTNTVASNAFDTPTMQSVVGVADGAGEDAPIYSGKVIILDGNTIIMEKGQAMAQGLEIDGRLVPASTVVVNDKDTIVKDHAIVLNADGVAKATFGQNLTGIESLNVDSQEVEPQNLDNIKVCDYLSHLSGPIELTTASIASSNSKGGFDTEDAETVKIADASNCRFETKTVLNAASPSYNEAGNWVGLLYAVQALASVLWAVVLPQFRSRKLSYSLSLLLGAVGFGIIAFTHSPYILFVGFALVGCAWAAMLAWPFTILTNSLHSGNIGAYLGLFNCTICIPQIVAALVGGWILSLLSVPGEIAPEYLMMMIAGISIAIGAFCVFIIKEGKGTMPVEETPVESETI